MQRLNGAYLRLEHPQALVTQAEILLILRDLHSRIKKLEGTTNELEKPTVSRAKNSRGTKKKVPTD